MTRGVTRFGCVATQLATDLALDSLGSSPVAVRTGTRVRSSDVLLEGGLCCNLTTIATLMSFVLASGVFVAQLFSFPDYPRPRLLVRVSTTFSRHDGCRLFHNDMKYAAGDLYHALRVRLWRPRSRVRDGGRRSRSRGAARQDRRWERSGPSDETARGREPGGRAAGQPGAARAPSVRRAERSRGAAPTSGICSSRRRASPRDIRGTRRRHRQGQPRRTPRLSPRAARECARRAKRRGGRRGRTGRRRARPAGRLRVGGAPTAAASAADAAAKKMPPAPHAGFEPQPSGLSPALRPAPTGDDTRQAHRDGGWVRAQDVAKVRGGDASEAARQPGVCLPGPGRRGERVLRVAATRRASGHRPEETPGRRREREPHSTPSRSPRRRGRSPPKRRRRRSSKRKGGATRRKQQEGGAAGRGAAGRGRRGAWVRGRR